jgi:VWFA-related protein
MFTRSHARAIRAALVLAIAILSGGMNTGCSTVQPVPSVIAASEKPPPPLKLCTDSGRPSAAIASRSGFMQLSVAVTDANGLPMRNLKESAFAANVGPQPVPIVYFQSDAKPRPVSIVMLIDISGSMQPKMPTVQKSLDDFMAKLNPCDEVAIFVFGSTMRGGGAEVTLIQKFTTDHRLAARQLESIKPYGRTPLYDAVDKGLRTLGRAHYSDRVILLITDGMDTASSSRKSDVIDEARADAVPIYAIGIGDPNANHETGVAVGPIILRFDDINRVDGPTLNELAQASHGRAFIVPEMKNDGGKAFEAAVAAIGGLIGRRYSIGVIAPAGAATPTVAVVNHPNATVQVYGDPRAEPAPSATHYDRSAAHS